MYRFSYQLNFFCEKQMIFSMFPHGSVTSLWPLIYVSPSDDDGRLVGRSVLVCWSVCHNSLLYGWKLYFLLILSKHFFNSSFCALFNQIDSLCKSCSFPSSFSIGFPPILRFANHYLKVFFCQFTQPVQEPFRYGFQFVVGLFCITYRANTRQYLRIRGETTRNSSPTWWFTINH